MRTTARLAILFSVIVTMPGPAQAETTLKPKAQPVVHPTATPAKATLTLQQLRAIIKNPGLTGGTATTRSPKGAATVNALRDLVKQEDAIATAARSTAASASRVPTPPSAGAASLKPGISQDASQLIDGIHSVNGKSTGFLVSPGNNVTIKGHGFGSLEGRADVAITFLDGRTAASLRVIRWTDDEIWALLPAGLSGAADQTAGIHVVTRQGSAYGKENEFQLKNGRFVAERAEVTVIPYDSDPYFPSWALGGTWIDITGGTITYDRGTGMRVRWHDGESITCKAASADVLTWRQNGWNGFVLVALTAQWGPTDSGDKDANGNAGSRTFSPGYGFGEWNGDSIPVRWGVWRSHTSPQANVSVVNGPYGVVGAVADARDWVSAGSSYDVCRSQYAVQAIVSGPRGVPPY